MGEEDIKHDSNYSDNIRVKYQAAITLKDSESQIQWSRYSAILVINTLLIGLIGLNDNEKNIIHTDFVELLQYIPLIGIFICILWLITTWKGFKWSQFWIKKANEIENDLPGGINPIQEGAQKQSKYLKTEYAAYLMISIFIAIYSYFLSYSLTKLPISVSINLTTLEFSEIFSNYTVGFGALLAGLGGLKILNEWGSNIKENNRRNKLRDELKVRYPSIAQGKKFRLIETKFPPGWVYLHDKIMNEKHHIASMLTMIKLGFNRDEVDIISQIEFNAIPEKQEFLTDGERYS